MSDQSTKNEGIQANNIKAEVIAVGQNAHAEQHKYSTHDAFQKSLDEMMAQLKGALAQVPHEQQEDAEAVAALSDDLVQTGAKENPNKKLLQIKGESLKAAAQNLAEVAPTVLLIATQVVGHILSAAR